MKKAFYLYWIFALLSSPLWAMDSGDNYNPTNPEDPDIYYSFSIQTPSAMEGTVYPTQPQALAEQATIWCSASPKLGYAFVNWTVDDSIVSTQSSFEFVMLPRPVVLVAHFNYVGYDPTNPEDPFAQGYEHNVSVSVSPANAGTTTFQHFKLTEGLSRTIVAYANTNFRFAAWKQNGSIVSTAPQLTITMGEEDLSYEAVFVYDPANPANPGGNLFNPATGELIMDDFIPGKLDQAITDMLGRTSTPKHRRINKLSPYDAVKSIRVLGQVTNSDLAICALLPACQVVDFSQTVGATDVMYKCFSSDQLTKVLLPASITHISNAAFDNCPMLEEIIFYSETPPTADNGAFAKLPQDVVIHVPSTAIARYQQQPNWNQLPLIPLSEEVSTFTVQLPADATDGRYANMEIEITNLTNGQVMTYLITDKTTYTFPNQLQKMNYVIRVKDANGNVLGALPSIFLGDIPLVLRFVSLLQPSSVRLQLVDDSNNDLTQQAIIKWFDANGQFLMQGDKLPYILENMVIRYSVQLDESISSQWLTPEDSSFTVVAGAQTLICHLQPQPKMVVCGSVYDSLQQVPVANMAISMNQQLTEQQFVSMVARTDAEGRFYFSTIRLPGTVSITDTRYRPMQVAFVEQDTVTLPAFALLPLNGTSIHLSCKYQSCANGTKSVVPERYTNWNNLAISVFNISTGTIVSDCVWRDSVLILTDGVSTNDSILLNITARDKSFADTQMRLKLTDMKIRASVVLVQHGTLAVTYTQAANPQIAGMLYRSNGTLVRTAIFKDKALTMTNVEDGTYIFVTMAKSPFYNSVNSLTELAAAGLKARTDYLSDIVLVQAGQVAQVEIDQVPFFDESRFYFTSDETFISINKTTTTLANYVTIKSQVKFLSQYANSVSNVKLVVDIPSSCRFVQNSLLDGNAYGLYVLAGNQLTIPITDTEHIIRFCVTPIDGGTQRLNAAVDFTMNEQSYHQPIGSVSFETETMQISVPEVTTSDTIVVKGASFAGCEVTIYDNGVVVGKTISKENGCWSARICLDQPASVEQHSIYAVVLTPDGITMQSEPKQVHLDQQAIVVNNVILYHQNPEMYRTYQTLFNFLNPKHTPAPYIYYIYNRDFSFTIDFSENNPAIIKDVTLNVKTGDGTWTAINATYNRQKGLWYAAGKFGNYYDGNIPVNVSVDYTTVSKYDTTIVTTHHLNSNNTDCNPMIDPSGYVYEAVSSNRLANVTATTYYKEITEDAGGNIIENTIKWDAENYDQQNPLLTDEDGMYRWDVPRGLWQVKFEKQGYITTYSDWLPVPPPQLEINIPMTQTKQPSVIDVAATSSSVLIVFDKYMHPATLTTDNITLLQNGQPVKGYIQLLDEESAFQGAELSYAKQVLFVPIKPLTATSIQLNISELVQSYAGICMETPYTQSLTLEQPITQLRVQSILSMTEGEQAKLIVAAQPVNAAIGKQMNVSLLSSLIAQVDSSTYTFDAQGHAVITITAFVPGSTTLNLSTERNSVHASTFLQINAEQALPTIIDVEFVTLDQSELTLKKGESAIINASVLPLNATNPSITWTSSDSSIVAVTEGEVFALNYGTAVITAQAGNVKQTCVVNVPQTSVTTDIIDMNEVPKVVKWIQHGHLRITRCGHVYDALGRMIK
ncbi:MAG: Ig-like domain-containing protein [Bacteroidales bacterium]|nr:Ig-like domain-containing protein [Candidatus Colicola coprequi]